MINQKAFFFPPYLFFCPPICADPMASPPTPQAGTTFAVKRKAEIVSEDPRSRARYDTSASRYDSAGHPYYGVESGSGVGGLDGHPHPTNGEHYDSSRRQHPSHPSGQNDHHSHHHPHHPYQNHQQQHRVATTPGKIYT